MQRFVGDSGYGMKDWLITPLRRNPDSQAERNLNRAHKSTRRIVECTYGILKQRIPCLKHLRLNPHYAGKVIMTCATFHNIASKDDFAYELPEDFPDENEGVIIQNPPVNAETRLATLMVYFT